MESDMKQPGQLVELVEEGRQLWKLEQDQPVLVQHLHQHQHQHQVRMNIQVGTSIRSV